MGRKRLPETEYRGKPLRIRLKPDERTSLDRAAEVRGFSDTSKWAREQLLRAAKRALQNAEA